VGVSGVAFKFVKKKKYVKKGGKFVAGRVVRVREKVTHRHHKKK
jgi:hypothetical protein